MTIIELLRWTSLLVLLYFSILKTPLKPETKRNIARGVSVVTLLLFVVQGLYWQHYLAFLALGLLAILVWIKPVSERLRLRRSLLILSVVAIFLSAFAVWAFPRYEMLTPTGTNAVGTTSFVLEDDSRLEHYTEDPTDTRRFKIQLWYPTDATDDHGRTPWIDDGRIVTRSLASDNYLPAFMLDHLVDTKSHSYLDAPIAESDSPYPIVVISHGWRGIRYLHSDLAEELASHGYVVVGIEHTYGSVATVFDEDDIAYLNLDALPPREETPDFLDYANRLVSTYAMDITTTLDYLTELNTTSQDSMFHGLLDLDTVGHIGHSTGGGAGVYGALMDDRIDALFGMDPWVEPLSDSELATPLAVPALFLRSGWWEVGENNEDLYTVISTSTALSQLYQVDGTTHFDFTMLYMISPLSRTIGFAGDVDGFYLSDMLRDLSLEFFNDTLRDGNDGTLDPSQWEELREIIVD